TCVVPLAQLLEGSDHILASKLLPRGTLLPVQGPADPPLHTFNRGTGQIRRWENSGCNNVTKSHVQKAHKKILDSCCKRQCTLFPLVSYNTTTSRSPQNYGVWHNKNNQSLAVDIRFY